MLNVILLTLKITNIFVKNKFVFEFNANFLLNNEIPLASIHIFACIPIIMYINSIKNGRMRICMLTKFFLNINPLYYQDNKNRPT